jgi:hypothetical protein
MPYVGIEVATFEQTQTRVSKNSLLSGLMMPRRFEDSP